ncbi:hypothetical protein MMC14_002380 [Varicellaria rhodocarpa]|nr:hypothetical protein [Varicellaria rhodocarpa]
MTTSVDAKLLKQTKFPPEFSQKVDMQKVNVEVMKKWIAGKISDILGNEDDVVIELCFNLLEGTRFPDIKDLQIQLTGFLDKDTAKFCKELWMLCLSAQSNPQGVPKELLEAKKLELIQEKIDAEKAAEEARRRKEQEKTKDRNIDSIRQRERGERGRGRGRGGRGGPDFDRRPPRDSRSPPSRRRGSRDKNDYRDPPPRREVDTYIPGGRGGRYSDDRRRRSPSAPHHRPPSRSLTPPRRRRREESNEPKGRRRYPPNKSPTPVKRVSERGRGRRTPDRGDDRARSFTPSETSRSQIEGDQEDLTDHLPMLLTVTPVIHELIIVKDEDTMKTGDVAEAGTVTGALAENASTDPSEENLLEAGVQAVKETGSVTAPSRDMHLQGDEDATAPLCLHLSRSVQRGRALP